MMGNMVCLVYLSTPRSLDKFQDARCDVLHRIIHRPLLLLVVALLLTQFGKIPEVEEPCRHISINSADHLGKHQNVYLSRQDLGFDAAYRMERTVTSDWEALGQQEPTTVIDGLYDQAK
jgi:hypothetical protein